MKRLPSLLPIALFSLLRVAVYILLVGFSVSGYGQAGFVGSERCQSCHVEQTRHWQESEHWHSMAEASESSVLGDFDNAEFTYYGITSTFYKNADKYFVKTDNDQGELEEFEVSYTFGVYPLQQYLIEFSDGRLQTLSITWDSRAAEEGGQRWYHLYPDEEVDFKNPLHWTGAFQNWNSRCASCHSTNLQKNYSLAQNTYETTFSEINVSCESCHGPGSEHLSWAEGNELENKGLVNSLKKVWSPLGTAEGAIDEVLANLSPVSQQSEQMEVCAACHSRRTELAHRDLGLAFLDNHNLSVLSEGLYYPDGQIQDEVYVYGSFLQSKMHQNQVTCSNCHEPHTEKLLIEGNGLCLQCHSPDTFENESHFFHEQGSSGAQCVNCHMPATTYMGVDERRDHSFKIPDPFASVLTGAPNACTGCHVDEDNAWAAENLQALTGRDKPFYPHGITLAKARKNDALVLPELVALANDENYPAIVRATAISETRRYPSEQTLDAVITALESPDALIRANAVSVLEFLPVPNRYQILQPYITDPVKSVRMEVARKLAGLPVEQLSKAYADQLLALFTEFIETSVFNADFPGTMTDLGLFYIGLGDYENAEKAFLQAKTLSQGYLPVLLNLADLYRMQKRDAEGELLLKEAIVQFPESANPHHALGLLLIREQRLDESLASLKKATELDQENARFVLVYSLALEATGDLNTAIEVLREGVQRFPMDNQLYELLGDFSRRP